MAVNTPDQRPQFYPRHLAPRVRAALQDTPVVLINGPRQAGKSTLAQSLISDDFPAEYVTLDDATVLGAARAGPVDFLAGFSGPVIIDEVQRAPELLVALKAAADRDRAPGRYLLTGSAHFRFIPQIAEALVGRVEILTLWPLSQGEIEGRRETFLDRVLAGEAPRPRGESLNRRELLARAITGGYPEVVGRRASTRRRAAWFSAYLTTVLQREVRDLAEIEGLTELPRLLALVAARAGGLQNFSELSRVVGLPQTTLKRYLALLEATFLVQSVPAWSGNLAKRLLKSSKLYPTDTGLMSHLLGLEEGALEAPASPIAPIGPLLESFLLCELRKQVGWSEAAPTIHHFRSARQEEVDIVLEDRRRRIVGIEVKASATVEARDFRHLTQLRDDLGKRFVAGFVLHTGREAVAFGRDLRALPIAALWRS
jgi:predicted AAA+ superfamily ATPase